jgi:hypothetical protein
MLARRVIKNLTVTVTNFDTFLTPPSLQFNKEKKAPFRLLLFDHNTRAFTGIKVNISCSASDVFPL